MTNFEPLKQLIWESAKADNKKEFNENCDALMKKASEDIWRMGWSIAPKDIDEVYKLLDEMSKWCHEKWLEAMKNGDAPPEDVSPGEGFLLLKNVIKEAVEERKPRHEA